MKPIDLEKLQTALRKRCELPYHWHQKQQNDWDTLTNFIYQCRSFELLQHHIKDWEAKRKDYALNRWLNFWSAKGVEQIFAQHQKVKTYPNEKSKTIDFFIENIPFDHKTTIFPKGFGHSLEQAQAQPQLLIDWLYQNQSQEGRMHWHNRLFLVLYDTKQQEHWKIKAEIDFFQSKIEAYLAHFKSENLPYFYHQERKIYADIIWCIF